MYQHVWKMEEKDGMWSVIGVMCMRWADLYVRMGEQKQTWKWGKCKKQMSINKKVQKPNVLCVGLNQRALTQAACQATPGGGIAGVQEPQAKTGHVNSRLWLRVYVQVRHQRHVRERRGGAAGEGVHTWVKPPGDWRQTTPTQVTQKVLSMAAWWRHDRCQTLDVRTVAPMREGASSRSPEHPVQWEKGGPTRRIAAPAIGKDPHTPWTGSKPQTCTHRQSGRSAWI